MRRILGVAVFLCCGCAAPAHACESHISQGVVYGILGLIIGIPIFGLWALVRSPSRSQWPIIMVALFATGISLCANPNGFDKACVLGSMVAVVAMLARRLWVKGELFEGALGRLDLDGAPRILGGKSFLVDGAPVCVRGTAREVPASDPYRQMPRRVIDAVHLAFGSAADLLREERRRRNLLLKLGCAWQCVLAIALLAT